MLKLLLDEHISPKVAYGLCRRNGSLVVRFMAEWEKGEFLGRDDSACLQMAASQRLTFVSCDCWIIPLLLKVWAEEGRSPGGVIFVDEKTISPADIGQLLQAPSNLWEQSARWDWTDRICYLER
jgi:hypothetical protein